MGAVARKLHTPALPAPHLQRLTTASPCFKHLRAFTPDLPFGQRRLCNVVGLEQLPVLRGPYIGGSCLKRANEYSEATSHVRKQMSRVKRSEQHVIGVVEV